MEVDKDELVKRVFANIPVVMRCGIMGGKNKYFIKELLAIAYRKGYEDAKKEVR